MLLSIITINFNQAKALKKTIESVLSQNDQRFEYIVIDGGSTDESVAVIGSFQDKIHHWVSEPDRGIYDAMNKGIVKARGKYVLMLNAGDYLHDDSVVSDFYRQNFSEDIVYGNVLWHEGERYFEGTFPKELSFDFFRRRSLGHQATFIRKSAHDRVGLYDESVRITADWKFLVLAICKFNLVYRHIDRLVSVCSRDGISCDPKSLPMIEQEKEAVISSEFKRFASDYSEADRLRLELDKLKTNIVIRIIAKLDRLIHTVL